MPRLPQPGADKGNWGEILNDYLGQSHDAVGKLKADSVVTDTLADGVVTADKLASGVISPVGLSGDYADLTGKPTIPTTPGQVGAEPANLSTATMDALNAKFVTVGSDGQLSVGGSVVRLPDGRRTFDQVFAAPVAADVPTVSVSTVSSLVGGAVFRPMKKASDQTLVDMDGDTHFRYDGTPSLSIITNGNFGNAPLVPTADAVGKTVPFINRFHFLTPYTDRVEISFRPPSTSGHRYRLWINGQPLSQMTTMLDPMTTGAEYYMLLIFPSARVREITWESSSRLAIGGVVVPAGLAPSRPAMPAGPRIAFIGDSYTDGAGSPPEGAGRADTWAGQFAKAYGAKEWAQWAIGGTGWGVTLAPFTARTSSIIDYAPDMVVILGSINDGTAYSESLRTAVTTVLGSLSVVPKVYVIGAQLPAYDKTGTGTITDYTGNNEAVRASSLVAQRPFLDMIGGLWLNTDTDLGTDRVHPTFAGHQKIARRAYAEIPAWVAPVVTVTTPVGAATVTTLSTSVSSASVGDVVTLSVIVTPGVATGSVQFKDDTTVLGTATVQSGAASFNATLASPGSRTLTATFIPDTVDYRTSSNTAVVTVMAGYSLGVNDYAHRYMSSDVTGSVGDIVSTVPDVGGSSPLTVSPVGAPNFTVQEESGERYIRISGTGVTAHLQALDVTTMPSTVFSITRITALARQTPLNNGYNLSRAANGNFTFAASGTGPLITGNGGWVVAAYAGNGAASFLQINSTRVEATGITGPGTGAAYPAGYRYAASSLAASGTIIEVKETVVYSRVLTPSEVNTVVAAMQANSTLV